MNEWPAIGGEPNFGESNEEVRDLNEISGLSIELLAHLIPEKLFVADGLNKTNDPFIVNVVYLKTVYKGEEIDGVETLAGIDVLFKLVPGLFKPGVQIPQRGVITEILVTIPLKTVEQYLRLSSGNGPLAQAQLAVHVKNINGSISVLNLTLSPDGIVPSSSESEQQQSADQLRVTDFTADIEAMSSDSAERVRKHKELLIAIHNAIDPKIYRYRLDPLLKDD